MDLETFLDEAKDIAPAFTPEMIEALSSDSKQSYVSVDFESLLEERGLGNKAVLQITKELGEVAILAGGFFERMLLGQEPKDLDLFFRNSSDLISALRIIHEGQTQDLDDLDEDEEPSIFQDYELVTDLSTINKEHVRFIEFKDKKNLKPKIQLMRTMWYKSPEHVIDTFDFTAAQFAVFEGKLYMNPLSSIDVARKRLVLHRMTFPSSTLRRMVKYAQKGYYICPGSFQNIAQEVATANQTLPSGMSEMVYVD